MLWEHRAGTPALSQLLIKLNVDLLHNPARPFVGIYPNKLKTYAHPKTYVQTYMQMPTKNWRQPGHRAPVNREGNQSLHTWALLCEATEQ